MKIKGKVVYQKLSGGFWGIVDDNGREWRPVNMPEQLKQEGKQVSLKVKEVEEDMSIFMWGIPVRILTFQTFTP